MLRHWGIQLYCSRQYELRNPAEVVEHRVKKLKENDDGGYPAVKFIYEMNRVV